MEAVPDAVIVRKACKKYGRGRNAHVVLNRLDFDVKRGSIYALLGASGCGKTTLLSCVMGLRKVDSGTIRIFGYEPGSKESGVPGPRVGYMPQEIALYMEFSIRETMVLFGHLYGMTDQDILERMNFLIGFLKLPDPARAIHSLSGGQQRRISFALALFHQPELLILDEPTVGVDTLLRQTIWDHLRVLTKMENTTVILTTHYIEEAIRAQVVGFMRKGRLMTQDAPDNLLRRHSRSKLEDVFVSLCIQDKASRKDSEIVADEPPNEKIMTFCEQPPSKAQRNSTFRNHLGAILLKNFQRVRHYTLLSSLFVMAPTLVMLMFCLVLGGPLKNLKMGIVNHEWPQEPICQPFDDCLFLNLSCRFISHLDHKMVQLEPYEDEKSAMEAVEKGLAWGYLYFPANYSDSIIERIWDSTKADNGTFQNSIMTARMDMSNEPLALSVQRMVLMSFQDFINDMLKMCNISPNYGKAPIQIGSAILGPSEPSFQHFVLPGMLANMIFSFPMSTVICFVLMERMEGMLSRTWAAGVTDSELLVSQLVTQYIFLTVQIIPVVPLMYWYLDLVVMDSIHWFIILVILQGTCSIAMGMFISLLLPSLSMAALVALAVCFVSWFLSGTIWPLEAISIYGLKLLCWANPVTWYTEAYRDTIIRGWSITNASVWPAFLYGSLWTVTLFVAAVITFRYSKFKYMK